MSATLREKPDGSPCTSLPSQGSNDVGVAVLPFPGALHVRREPGRKAGAREFRAVLLPLFPSK